MAFLMLCTLPVSGCASPGEAPYDSGTCDGNEVCADGQNDMNSDSGPPPQAPCIDSSNSIELIDNDMSLPHEGLPHGVPLGYDWSQVPVVQAGNDAGGFEAFVSWGQVYEAAEGNPANNTRVHIKDIEAYILSRRTGQWSLLQDSTEVDGAAYNEDFQGDVSRPADIREESGGGISMTAGDGANFHFFHPTRATIDPEDIGGIFVTVRARLVLDDSTAPDDRDSARYLIDVGADYWRTLDAQWRADWSSNPGVAISRFRYVETGWQSFNMTTLTGDELHSNPPPMRDYAYCSAAP